LPKCLLIVKMPRHIHKEKLTPCRIYYVVGIWFNVNRVFFSFLFSCKIYDVVGIWLNVNKVLTALCLGFSWRCGFGVSSFTLMKFQGTPNEQEAYFTLKFVFPFSFCVLNLNSSSWKWVHFYSYYHIFMFTNVTYVISPNVKMIM